jgi:hypothetical protein
LISVDRGRGARIHLQPYACLGNNSVWLISSALAIMIWSIADLGILKRKPADHPHGPVSGLKQLE